jgi:hypothetical protein
MSLWVSTFFYIFAIKIGINHDEEFFVGDCATVLICSLC